VVKHDLFMVFPEIKTSKKIKLKKKNYFSFRSGVGVNVCICYATLSRRM